jgi:hypothetical protein
MNSFKQPLSVYFIWHNSDNELLEQPINHCFNMLKRDSKRPFSRSLNIPIFFRTSLTKNVPEPLNSDSFKTIVFVFISSSIVGDTAWSQYVETLTIDENYHVIPIALDTTAFNMGGCFEGVNAIRAFDFDKSLFKDELLISITHEIYRLALNESLETISLGGNTAIELFLSHAKDGKQGVKLAEKLKNFIDNTSMSNFFDANDIAPGYKFKSEIIGHIKKSTLIAIHSDPYSSRYWCQKEIQCSKENDRPIIAVDSLEEFEDRRFPSASNIPGVHVHLNYDNNVDTKDLYRVITTALLETVRFFYGKLLLNSYLGSGWFDENSVILSRPPEITDLLKVKPISDLNDTFIYPEPPIYEEELQVYKQLGINAYTPLNSPGNQFSGYKIGISISDLTDIELIKIGQGKSHLVHLAQDIARHLLARENIIIYGGNLEKNGFTEFLFNEAQALQTRTNSTNIFVKNYIAWPIYKKDSTEFTLWKANYKHIAEMIEVPPPANLSINSSNFLPPASPENTFIWSRSLSNMRNIMICDCDLRICAGGKSSMYKGKMPGVLEEILIAIQQEKPLYLLGGFGGVTKYVCNMIESGVAPVELTKEWQIEHNSGYADLLRYIESKESSYTPDYNDLANSLSFVTLKNGLSKEDNIRLFNTPFVDEALHLIFKGINNLK